VKPAQRCDQLSVNGRERTRAAETGRALAWTSTGPHRVAQRTRTTHLHHAHRPLTPGHQRPSIAINSWSTATHAQIPRPTPQPLPAPGTPAR
jgi:hypothetical protein